MSFTCQECGKCCHGLLLRDHGILRGLTLLPEETVHFPEEHVKPYLGVGKRPYDPRFNIVAYQLTTSICPHLVDEKCIIYPNRPSTCRQYPFSLDPDPAEGTLLGVDMNCPAAVELINASDGILAFPERDSAEKLLTLKQLAAENPRKAWLYDLDTGKWVRYDKLG